MKKKRKASKRKIKLFLAVIVFLVIVSCLSVNLFTIIVDIRKLNNEKDELEKQIDSLEEEREALETDLLKLNDEDYIAKYVREKYFYSKDGELILRMDK